MNTAAMRTIRRKVSNLAPDDDNAALEEARRRFADAKDAALKAKDRAADAIGELDTDGLRRDAKNLSAEVGHRLLEFGSDVTEATRHEADRIIGQIHEAAEQARREAEAARRMAEEAERKRRVRALIGWTAFGLVAGAVLSNALGSKSGTPGAAGSEEPSEDAEVPGLDNLEGGPVESDGTADAS